MRHVHGKPELPDHDPFLPVNRGVAAQEVVVETNSQEDAWWVTLYIHDIDVQDVRVDVTEQSLVIRSETDPPLRQTIEAPRCVKPETLRVERGHETMHVRLDYQEDYCLPVAPTPGGPYRGEVGPCIEHPRSETNSLEEKRFAVT